MSSSSGDDGGCGCLFLIVIIFLLSRSCEQQERIEKLEQSRSTYQTKVTAEKRSYYYGPYEMPPNYGYRGYLER